MPFTVKEFPGQRFETIDEYTEAKRRRTSVEKSLEARAMDPGREELTRVIATVLPVPPRVVEMKLVELEREVANLSTIICRMLESPKEEKRELETGKVLYGESQGREFTVEILENGYLCSDGKIYESLSGAALGVSGNRRSGWKFWKDATGTPIGVVTGRFSDDVGGVGDRKAEHM
jgi:hypothetical protein